jgi:hypothetical protein
MHGGKLHSRRDKYCVKVGVSQSKYVDVGDPSKQHLKFRSRQLAQYQARQESVRGPFFLEQLRGNSTS